MPKKSTEGKRAVVQAIADGTNKVSLVFPKAAKFKGKKNISMNEVLKLLGKFSEGAGDVEGQECTGGPCGSWFGGPCDRVDRGGGIRG